MKKTVLLITLLLLLAVSLVSCKLPFGQPPVGGTPGGDTDGTDENGENLIYNSDVDLYLVYDPEAISAEKVQEVLDNFFSMEIYIKVRSADDEPAEHEIIIGNVGRAASNSAYSQLERLETSTDSELRYCFYSNGSSLALAYDKDRDEYCLSLALEELFKDYVKEELTLAKGTYKKTVFDLYDYLGEIDSEKYAAQWQKLSDKYSPDVVAALRSFYSIYDGERLVTWLANLYDPSICVCKGLYGEEECRETQWCGTGGFYYSNSARDTLGYLPDVESTLQALGMLSQLGMNNSYVDLLPDEMGDAIVSFVYNLQDPDGFFYHPQWGKDIGVSRRGRDLNWSKNILSAYGKTAKYTLPDASGVSASVKMPLVSSKATLVSKVIAADATLVPDHLKTLDAFKDYLENELDLYNAAYPAGNTLASQTSQIQARGEEYVEAMFEHLDKTQNENGTWHPTPGYYAVNGLMKISGIYKNFQRAMGKSEAACLACFDAIMSDEDPSGVVDVWNAWVAITYVFENVRLFAPDGAAKEAELKENLVKNSVGAIEATRNKTNKFSRPDGSFSYKQTGNQTTSQGAPVALPGRSEGDVNGCMIATTQMISFVFSGLGMSNYKVDLCGLRERAILLDTLEELSPVVKLNGGGEVDEPLDFDYDDVGYLPDGIAPSFGKPANGSYVTVKEDPRPGSEGNVLSFKTASGSYDSISFNNSGSSVTAASYVFEAEMCITRSSTSTDFLRLEMGNSDDVSGVYRIAFKQEGNQIRIYDNSSSRGNPYAVRTYLGAFVKEGEWFKIRIEYYPEDGTEETVRAKVYLNDKLLAISDNYYDYNGKKLNGEGKPNIKATLTRVQFLTSPYAEVLLDNVHAYYSGETYKAEELHPDYASSNDAVNVDKK